MGPLRKSLIGAANYGSLMEIAYGSIRLWLLSSFFKKSNFQYGCSNMSPDLNNKCLCRSHFLPFQHWLFMSHCWDLGHLTCYMWDRIQEKINKQTNEKQMYKWKTTVQTKGWTNKLNKANWYPSSVPIWNEGGIVGACVCKAFFINLIPTHTKTSTKYY